MSESKCPFVHKAGSGPSNRDWWPNQLQIEILHQHSPQASPMGEDFSYAEAFKTLDPKLQKKGFGGDSLPGWAYKVTTKKDTDIIAVTGRA